MSDKDIEGEGVPATAGEEENTSPMLNIVTQYVKDLSFENPNAPTSLHPNMGVPEVEIGVNVQAEQNGEGVYNIQIQLNAKATHGDQTAFLVELIYGGLFNIKNFPQDAMEPLCMVECPRLLFPFARRVVADATRDGGYSPLLLDPIDFAGLYQRHKAQQAANVSTETGNA